MAGPVDLRAAAQPAVERGKNEPVTGPSLLAEAVDEIYAAPPAEFTARRKALAAAAKKAGDRDAATAIGALRKPTLSADTVNRLVRGAPDEVGELLQLGADLRQAEAALDAAELRRLGDRRRHLVNDLADLAFELTGQSKPSATVRDEVTATLNAALADEEVARRLSSGALVTQARWDGFGSTQLPELAASMPDLPRPRTATATRAKPPTTTSPAAQPEPRAKSEPPDEPEPPDEQDAPAKRTPRSSPAERAASTKRAAETDRQRRAREQADAKAAQQQREAAKATAAQQAAADAAAEAAAAAAARAAEAQELVSTIDRRVSELNLQLAHQRRLLADAQRALRAAETDRRTTALAATRAGAPAR